MVFSMSLEFLLSAFLRRKHFSLELFSTHLLLVLLSVAQHLCYSLFHFLRSPVEIGK